MQHSDNSDRPIDLNCPRILRVRDVAKLLGISTTAVLRRTAAGTIPVKPRRLRPHEWSSLDWHKWFQAQ